MDVNTRSVLMPVLQAGLRVKRNGGRIQNELGVLEIIVHIVVSHVFHPGRRGFVPPGQSLCIIGELYGMEELVRDGHVKSIQPARRIDSIGVVVVDGQICRRHGIAPILGPGLPVHALRAQLPDVDIEQTVAVIQRHPVPEVVDLQRPGGIERARHLLHVVRNLIPVGVNQGDGMTSSCIVVDAEIFAGRDHAVGHRGPLKQMSERLMRLLAQPGPLGGQRHNYRCPANRAIVAIGTVRGQ